MEKLQQLDSPGVLISLASLICLILALQRGNIFKPWGSANVIGTLVDFSVTGFLFIGIEIYQDKRAMMVPRLLKQKTMVLLASSQVTGFAGFVLFMHYLPMYFQVVGGVSAADSRINAGVHEWIAEFLHGCSCAIWSCIHCVARYTGD